MFIHLIVSFMHAALWRGVTEPLDWRDLILETVGKIRVENGVRCRSGNLMVEFARERIRAQGSERNFFTFCENERKRSMRYECSRIIAIGSLVNVIVGVTNDIA